jgi:putative salt-induced outer membrane protein YdiY
MLLRNPSALRWLAAATLASAGLCSADQITLDNGDRISGTVTRLAGGTVAVHTDYAGDISIDLAHVVALRTDAEMTVLLDDNTRLYGRLTGDAHTLEVVDTGQKIDIVRVSGVEPGHVSGREWHASGRFALGASSSSGNSDASNLNFDTEGVWRQDRNRFTAGARGNYARSRGAETDNNTIVYGQYDRFLTKKWYALATASFENNPFADIALRSTIGAGLGYQWFDTPRTKLALEAGLAYVHTDYDTQPTVQNLAARLATRFDYWLWQDRVQFFNYNQFYLGLDEFENSFLRSQTGFRLPIIDRFSAIAQLNLDWNGNPPPGTVELDRTVILSVGYQW